MMNVDNCMFYRKLIFILFFQKNIKLNFENSTQPLKLHSIQTDALPQRTIQLQPHMPWHTGSILRFVSIVLKK